MGKRMTLENLRDAAINVMSGAMALWLLVLLPAGLSYAISRMYALGPETIENIQIMLACLILAMYAIGIVVCAIVVFLAFVFEFLIDIKAKVKEGSSEQMDPGQGADARTEHGSLGML